MERKNHKEFLILKILAFESAASNCQNPEGDMCLGSQYVTKHP